MVDAVQVQKLTIKCDSCDFRVEGSPEDWHKKECPECGEMMRPHHVCPHCGAYKGREVKASSEE